MTIILVCKHCGKSFRRREDQVHRAKYCSKPCKYTDHRKKRSLRSDAIQLSNGQWALVSADDLDYMRQYGWVMTPDGRARRGASKHTSMHRVVMERAIGRPLLSTEEVDHINGIPLDNRRTNLRISSRSENMRNQQNRRPGISGLVGVSYSQSGRWRAYLVLNYEQVSAGVYSTPEEAAWMRDQWAIELHGEFARLNFDYL